MRYETFGIFPLRGQLRRRRVRTRTESRRRVIAVLASVLAAAASAAQADTPSAPEGLSALRRSPVYRQQVIAGSQRSGTWVSSPCAGATFTLGERLGINAPPRFDEKGTPLSGAWTEHVTASGCSAERVLNVLVVARGPGQLAMIPLLPGSTRADPTLQKDGAVYAFLAAKVDHSGCKPIYIADTVFLDFSTEPAAVPGKPAWSERWTVVQCDKRVPVVLRFVPDQRGTAIVVDRPAGQP